MKSKSSEEVNLSDPLAAVFVKYADIIDENATSFTYEDVQNLVIAGATQEEINLFIQLIN